MFKCNPWSELYSDKIEDANICIMGIPFDGAVSCGKGAAQAPEMIRSLSRYWSPYTERGNLITNMVYDAGDVQTELNWESYYEKVEKEALKLLDSGKFCLFLGGDHSTTIPVHKAFFQKFKGKKIGVIHFDSHSDIFDVYDGHKWSHACTQMRAIEQLDEPSDVAFVGIRAWGKEEVEYFQNHPEIFLKKAWDVSQEGHQSIAKQLIEKFKSYDIVFLSVDIDVLDPAFAPGTGTPEPGGLTTRELMEMLTEITKELPIGAMDIVEVSPPLDSKNNITSWAALKLMYEIFYSTSWGK
jgi:agmatinase